MVLSFTKKNYISIFTQHTSFLKFPIIHKLFLNLFIDKYIAISNPTFESLSSNVKKGKIFKIWNGIKVDSFLSTSARGSGDKCKLITVSRLDDIKNHEILLKAISTIVSDNKEFLFSLDIVGSGPNEGKLKSLVEELNVSEYVSFLGTRKDVPELLSRSDVFLLPSIREGFSISLIEALCSGINIIASDVGGNKEILNDGQFGYLFKNNDELELINAICYFLNNKKTNKFSSSRKLHIEKLSIQASANQHIKLYNELINIKK